MGPAVSLSVVLRHKSQRRVHGGLQFPAISSIVGLLARGSLEAFPDSLISVERETPARSIEELEQRPTVLNERGGAELNQLQGDPIVTPHPISIAISAPPPLSSFLGLPFSPINGAQKHFSAHHLQNCGSYRAFIAGHLVGFFLCLKAPR